MGSFASVFERILSYRKDIRILMVGLDATGLQTIFYKLKYGNTFTNPTDGFKFKTDKFNVNFTVWDMCGQRKIPQDYFVNTRAVIFVLDCNDKVRIDEAKDELHRLMQETNLSHAILLVFADKQVDRFLLPFTTCPH